MSNQARLTLRDAVLLSASLISSIAVLSIDLVWVDISPLAAGPPIFEPVYILRTVLIACSSALFVAAVARPGLCGDGHGEAPWKSWGTVQWQPEPEPEAGGPTRHSISVKRLIGWLFIGGTLFFVGVARRAPGLVNRVAREDGLVETLSFALLILGCFLFAYVAYRRAGHGEHDAERAGRLFVAVPLLLALLLFVIAMEEISWFQRYVGIETPAGFTANDQGELNLHNLATLESENLYYFGAFVLLIVIPFLVEHGRLPRWIALLAPSRFILFALAVLVAFNFNTWNTLFTQWPFFVTLLVVLHYGGDSRRAGGDGMLAFGLAATLLITQLSFLMIGDAFPRPYVLKEYKELLIPLGFLLYASEATGRIARRAGRT